MCIPCQSLELYWFFDKCLDSGKLSINSGDREVYGYVTNVLQLGVFYPRKINILNDKLGRIVCVYT